jgi:hypothetical protein
MIVFWDVIYCTVVNRPQLVGLRWIWTPIHRNWTSLLHLCQSCQESGNGLDTQRPQETLGFLRFIQTGKERHSYRDLLPTRQQNLKLNSYQLGGRTAHRAMLPKGTPFRTGTGKRNEQQMILKVAFQGLEKSWPASYIDVCARTHTYTRMDACVRARAHTHTHTHTHTGRRLNPFSFPARRIHIPNCMVSRPRRPVCSWGQQKQIVQWYEDGTIFFPVQYRWTYSRRAVTCTHFIIPVCDCKSVEQIKLQGGWYMTRADFFF